MGELQVLLNPEEGYGIARTAYEAASAKVDSGCTALSPVALSVMQELHANLASWHYRPGGWRHEMSRQARVQAQIDARAHSIFW